MAYIIFGLTWWKEMTCGLQQFLPCPFGRVKRKSKKKWITSMIMETKLISIETVGPPIPRLLQRSISQQTFLFYLTWHYLKIIKTKGRNFFRMWLTKTIQSLVLKKKVVFIYNFCYFFVNWYGRFLGRTWRKSSNFLKMSHSIGASITGVFCWRSGW